MELQTKYLSEDIVRNVFYYTAPLLFVYILLNVRLAGKTIPGFPLVGKEEGEWFNATARKRFAANSKEMLQRGLQQDFFEDYPAFAAMKAGHEGHIVLNTINKKLTTALALITEPVNEENTAAMNELWPIAKEWTPTAFVPKSQLLTSQVSSRIFLGTPLCRDPEWIRIARDYTINLMTAAYAMRATPSILRPILYHFLEPVNRLKNTVKQARAIIEPEVQKRRKIRAEALARGEVIPKHLDSIDWMDEIAQDRKGYDFTGAQLTLTFVAIHTTSSTLGHLMYDVIEHSELIPELRQEIVEALKEDGGWKKTTLYKMKLMDSVMKESQRMNMLGNLVMTRVADQNVTLSDGTVIPKDTRLYIPSLHLRQSEYYPEPDKFDGKRFLRLREQPGNVNRYQFVTTSAEHIGFGHGQHACPGRFFASNEIKLMLAHLIMKYDWNFKDGRPKNHTIMGNEINLDPTAEILYKSRVPEIEF